MPSHGARVVMALGVREITADERGKVLEIVQAQLAKPRGLLGLEPGTPYLAPRCPMCGHVETYSSADGVPLAHVPCPVGCDVFLIRWIVQQRIATPAEAIRQKIIAANGRRFT